ncbi:ATP-binding protein [Danxiaibacter flavus]|uniref:ATP-binding protein n=1 Tax=Danxiaibacter flavus TaxID=3049108 RepID=A0ABV3ZCA3_9BACT|nr:ATP-binding protein [Chitinophagaceae bacterium DXS]
MNEQRQYITHVNLSGYKSIQNLECDFEDGLNIIIGDNGSGKSNFFEFLHFCFTGEVNRLYNFSAGVELNGKPGLIEWNNTLKVFEEGHELYGLPYTDVPNFPLRYEFVQFNMPHELSVLADELVINFDLNKSKIASGAIKPIAPLFATHFVRIVNRILRNTRSITDDLLLEQLNTAFNIDYATFKESVGAYTPVEDIRISNALRISKVSSDVVEIRNLLFEYKINGSWFSWNGLSDGTKRMIYLIGVLCGYNSADQSIAPKVVFIEEPEIGIHPHQLHLILNFLRERSKNQQIFISTHSPQVLDILNADELNKIIIAEITAKDGTKFRHLSEAEMNKAQLYFKDEGLLSEYWRFSDLQRTEKI